MIRISIYEDQIYAGSGSIDAHGTITCAAILGESQDTAEVAYAAIENAIRGGASIVSSGSHDYSWEVAPSDDLMEAIEEMRSKADGDQALRDLCDAALEHETAALLKCAALSAASTPPSGMLKTDSTTSTLSAPRDSCRANCW